MSTIAFFGTPAIASYTLEQLTTAGHTVCVVITEPSARSGRGMQMVDPPVKATADELNIPVVQPGTAGAIASILERYRPDLGVVLAYGRIIPRSALEIPTYGILNIHPSLLPRYRGAAPVAHAILHGDTKTGTTIMKLDEGMDTGPILSQTSVPISPTATTQSLTWKLVRLGTTMLINAIDPYIAGTLQPTPQPEEGGMLAPKLTKETGLIDWHLPATKIDQIVRACIPWPRAYTEWRGTRLLILDGAVQDNQYIPTTVQLAGKRAVSWDDFVRGQRLDSASALRELTGQPAPGTINDVH